jgi:hypothetical protein
MSRLTFRDSKGELWIKDAADIDEQGQICMLTDRLAAYEDTGLEPEEVAELAQAKADGRCVVLPCKVGDAVYYPFAGRVIEKRVSKYTEILRKSECVDKWYCVEFSDDETFDEEDVGKTVFLTQKEAEQALKGGAE